MSFAVQSLSAIANVTSFVRRHYLISGVVGLVATGALVRGAMVYREHQKAQMRAKIIREGDVESADWKRVASSMTLDEIVGEWSRAPERAVKALEERSVSSYDLERLATSSAVMNSLNRVDWKLVTWPRDLLRDASSEAHFNLLTPWLNSQTDLPKTLSDALNGVTGRHAWLEKVYARVPNAVMQMFNQFTYHCDSDIIGRYVISESPTDLTATLIDCWMGYPISQAPSKWEALEKASVVVPQEMIKWITTEGSQFLKLEEQSAVIARKIVVSCVRQMGLKAANAVFETKVKADTEKDPNYKLYDKVHSHHHIGYFYFRSETDRTALLKRYQLEPELCISGLGLAFEHNDMTDPEVAALAPLVRQVVMDKGTGCLAFHLCQQFMRFYDLNAPDQRASLAEALSKHGETVEERIKGPLDTLSTLIQETGIGFDKLTTDAFRAAYLKQALSSPTDEWVQVVAKDWKKLISAVDELLQIERLPNGEINAQLLGQINTRLKAQLLDIYETKNFSEVHSYYHMHGVLLFAANPPDSTVPKVNLGVLRKLPEKGWNNVLPSLPAWIACSEAASGSK